MLRICLFADYIQPLVILGGSGLSLLRAFSPRQEGKDKESEHTVHSYQH